MPRVALVTGGTRGIVAAIAVALKSAGYRVAANYGGNDDAATKFKSENGIPVFKWDVSSFESCADGVKKVEADVGPVEVLVNNAGITKDGMFHKMTPDQWNAGLVFLSRSCLYPRESFFSLSRSLTSFSSLNRQRRMKKVPKLLRSRRPFTHLLFQS
jgi:NAD(P)-dependent dehydrogenase (short-subunit alcohol dehydrogenase family)